MTVKQQLFQNKDKCYNSKVSLSCQYSVNILFPTVKRKQNTLKCTDIY
jgi:hypothetical protein